MCTMCTDYSFFSVPPLLEVKSECVQCVQITVFFVSPTSWKVKSEMCTMCTDYSFFCVPHLLGSEE